MRAERVFKDNKRGAKGADGFIVIWWDKEAET